ncbi:MAG: cytochrome c biogenesis protein CcsA [Opitutaceae bacterium]|nr:cytochrome c biogenesis protein CcsA [Opitutaceae bacterium]
MKKFIPLSIVVLMALYALSTLRAPKNPAEFDVTGFGKLPVLLNGRMKPLDTVARSALLQLQGRQSVSTPDGRKLLPTEWLLDVSFRPERADTYRTFEITHPELLALFNLKPEDGDGKKRFAYNQLSGKFGELDRQTKLAQQVDSAVRSVFQRAVVQLYHNLVHYQRLRHALVSPGRDDFLGDLLAFETKVAAGVAAVRAKQAGQPHDEAAASAMTEIGERFVDMANIAGPFLVVPPAPDNPDPNAWKPAGAALLDTFRTGRVDPTALAYAGFAHAWRTDKADRFNKLLELYRADIVKRFPERQKKADAETRFNAAQPFYTASIVYAAVFLLGFVSWLVWPDALQRSAFWLMGLAWLLTTAGILTRMWLEGRPPVTNLYSSALFVGWGTVLLCLILERTFKNGIASVAGGTVGFATLIIAHNLSLSGDTLEMMRAVLDTNFWLATHVVIVTIGYSATFLAGFLAIIYILRGLLSSTLDKDTADSLGRMVYGIVCFATLFSFVGTVLGGIWADQSWGRFWGWDPKENGALMIVIWNAIILHARWGGLVKQRGIMVLAIGGNIITAWSWFGTNMLGVGLHSYGFTDAAFVALAGFVVSQLAIIGLGLIPLDKWRSFRRGSGRVATPLAAASAKTAP